jgi:hypothetical protein
MEQGRKQNTFSYLSGIENGSAVNSVSIIILGIFFNENTIKIITLLDQRNTQRNFRIAYQPVNQNRSDLIERI